MEGIMIHSQSSIYLKISKVDTTFKISSGTATNFITDQSILVGPDNPNLLWNLLYSLTGMPLPELIDRKKIIEEFLEQKQELPVESPQKEMSDKEKELSTLSASEIVAKVFSEKGIQITNSLKSKAAIIRKALKIYEK
jgi:hypothetical protein